MDLGMGELVVIFLVVMILFGANKLPALGEGLGKAIRGFKDSMRDEPPAAPPAPQGQLPTPAPKAELPAVPAGGDGARKDPS